MNLKTFVLIVMGLDTISLIVSVATRDANGETIALLWLILLKSIYDGEAK